MHLAIMGGGYVGLVTGACLATFGHKVTIIEADPQRYRSLAVGDIPFHEPGLADLVLFQRDSGLLTFAMDLEAALCGVDAVFLAVETPARRGDGAADLKYVFAAVRQMAAALSGPAVIVTKSTMPVGTTRRISRMMHELRPDLHIEVAANPEFLRNGKALLDFLRPDRVVIGCEGPRARALLEALYVPLVRRGAKLVTTGLETAELVKYASNSFLAMKIGFINEMADICDKVGADIADVALGMSLDRRIGAQFLQPGPGFGGSGLPGDTEALARIAQKAGAPSRLVESTIASNTARKAALAGRIIKACGGSVAGVHVAILGLTFKPETDELSESPALPVISNLVKEGALVRVYDPKAINVALAKLGPGVFRHESARSALSGADVAVFMTEWAELQKITPRELRQWMRGRRVVDFRNIFEPSALRAAGFDLPGVGRPLSAIRQRPPADVTFMRPSLSPNFAQALSS